MTREEAIKGLKVLRRDFSGYKPNEEMFDISIQALEQEQQRQEDIYECQYCFGEVHKNYIYCPFCGKRIEALEQEETLQNLTKPNKSDLISRQAAIDGVKTLHDVAWKKWHEPTLSTNVVLDMIRELPSAQPFTTEQIQTMQELESAQIEKAYELGKADRPTGHWIDTEFLKLKECSCCHCRWGMYDVENFDFCPNCGARMESDEE